MPYEPLIKPNTAPLEKLEEQIDLFATGDALQSNSLMDLNEFIEAMPEDSSAPFVTQGKVTSAKLLKQLLKRTGKASVYITSWSITQGAVEQLIALKNEGLIGALTIVLDNRAPVNWPNAFQMLAANCDKLRLAKCHAKTILVYNQNHAAMVISSLNWSEQHTRFEAGYITTHRAHVFTIATEIDKLYNKAKPWN